MYSKIALHVGVMLMAVSCASGPPKTTATHYNSEKRRPAVLVRGRAIAPPEAPAIVKNAVDAGNRIQHVPYQFGGGHGRPSHGLDCSGTVSYVLRQCGLLQGATTSRALRDFGERGPGKWITVYARDGHAFMTVAGLRLDTTGGGRGEQGPRWNTKPRNIAGFTARHPQGL